MKSPVRTEIRGLISLRFPVEIFRNVKEIMPRLKPVAMLKVRGVATRVRKAGKASVKSFQLTLATAPHMREPTMMGAVAKEGMAAITGAQNIAAMKNPEITRLPRPVRAPAANPGAPSM